MPGALKVAILSPMLKKCDADFEQFQNFRPISNLKVVSKLVEKAFAIQLTDHVTVLCKSNANEFRQNSWLFVAFRRNFT